MASFKTSVKNFFQRIKFNGIILALALIALGFVLALAPSAAIKIATIIVACVCLVFAVIELIGFFAVRGSYSFAKGIFYLAIGIWLFICSQSVLTNIINIVFSFAVILSGAEQIETAVRLARYRYKFWWILLIIGLVSLTLGLVVLFYTGATFILLGAFMIVAGVFSLVKMIVFDAKLRRLINKAKSASESSDSSKAKS